MEESKNNYSENENEEEEKSESLLFHNIDANVDKNQIELEKHIQKLPPSLKFIKKYIYYTFFPHLENTLDDLEYLKTTPNYDERIVKVRPKGVKNTQNNNITCIDLLRNHNIKHSKLNKMIFGTLKGNVCIYDIENDKIVTTQNVSEKNRVDCIASSTTKYFDTYLTRIAVNCRSEIFIYIYSYNHSFSGMHLDCTINTVNPEVSDPVVNEKINLSYLINTLKFSKDGFYLSAIDYAGGVYLYKFHEIPISISVQSGNQTQNEESKESEKKEDNKKTKDTKEENKSKFIFIARIECDEQENFTILPKDAVANENAKNDKNKKDPKKKDDKAKKDNAKKPNKKDDKKDTEEEELDPTLYNIKYEYDENLGDISLYQTYDKHHPLIHFIQKNFISEDNSNSGYSSCIITIGVYIAFSNSTNFKFFSLYPYLTDNMKAIFKIQKVKTTLAMTPEDTLNYNSTLAKKERDFLNYIKSILDPKNPNYKANVTTSNELNTSSKNEEKKDDKKDNKKKDDKKDNKKDNKKKDDKNSTNQTEENKEIILKSISPIDLKDITKNEMSFTTLFNISTMIGQKTINSINNLLTLGMIDGGILVWDCELHTDKYLLQKNSRFEITNLCIDENYLLCGTIVGQIYIYELLTGKELYYCAHNTYYNLPIFNIVPFFPFMMLAFDSNNKICVYNTKEFNKPANLLLNPEYDMKTNYKISYANSFLVDFNKEFIVFICEKSDEKIEKLTLVDLINRQKDRIEFLKNKPKKTTTDFFNLKQIDSNPKPKKIDELSEEEKKKKEEEEKKKKEEEEKKKKEEEEKNKRKKTRKNTKKLTKKKKEEEIINKEENKEKLPEPLTKIEVNEKFIIVYRIRDILFKCYPDLVYSYKKGLSLKKIMKKYNSDDFPTFDKANYEGSPSKGSPIKGLSSNKMTTEKVTNQDANAVKLDLLANLKGENTDNNNNITVEDTVVKNQNNSTQQKDVFYHSFKNIRERYQYKEQRINNIQMRNEQILRDLEKKERKK